MDFIVIDIEQAYTPSTQRNDEPSSCISEIGIILVRDYKIDFQKAFWVKPNPFKFGKWNIGNYKKVGLTPDFFKEKPEFGEIYNSKLKEYFEKYPIFYYSYTNSDIRLVHSALTFYNIELPKTVYFNVDSIYRKKNINRQNKGNKLVDAHNEIFKSDIVDNHLAETGTKACAEIIIKLIKDNLITNIEQIPEVFKVQRGDMSIRLYSKEKSPKKSKEKKSQIKSPIVLSKDYKANAPKNLEGKLVLFTCLSKTDEIPLLKELVKLNNGTVSSQKVPKWTKSDPNLIVVGEGWPEKAKSKSPKANDLGIEVITKEDFLHLVKYTDFTN